MLWDMHLCVFDVRFSFENRVNKSSLKLHSIQIVELRPDFILTSDPLEISACV